MVFLLPIRMGSGLINLLPQGIGGTFGLAMMTTMLQRRTVYHTGMLDQQQAFSPLSWNEGLEPGRDLVARAGEIGAMIDVKAVALLRRHLTQQATVAAYQDCFLLIVFLCVLAMPLVLFLRRQTPD